VKYIIAYWLLLSNISKTTRSFLTRETKPLVPGHVNLSWRLQKLVKTAGKKYKKLKITVNLNKYFYGH